MTEPTRTPVMPSDRPSGLSVRATIHVSLVNLLWKFLQAGLERLILPSYLTVGLIANGARLSILGWIVFTRKIARYLAELFPDQVHCLDTATTA